MKNVLFSFLFFYKHTRICVLYVFCIIYIIRVYYIVSYFLVIIICAHLDAGFVFVYFLVLLDGLWIILVDCQVLPVHLPRLILPIDHMVNDSDHLQDNQKIGILRNRLKNNRNCILPVGSRTRRESTAALLPLQGSNAMGLGAS